MITQIPIGLCALILSICPGLGIGVWHCEWTIMVYSHWTTPRTRPRPKKKICIGLCGSIHTAQRPMTTQIPIGFCVLLIGIGLELVLGVAQCE